MGEISDKFVSKSSGRNDDFGTANGLARLVRRRWPVNTVGFIQSEWDLTEGEAKGVLYAQASRATIDKIKKHSRGGWRVFLEVDAAVIGESLEQFLTREQRRLADERARQEADERRLVEMAGRVGAVFGLGGVRPSGLADRSARPLGERRSRVGGADDRRAGGVK